jgi:hypothetical protein
MSDWLPSEALLLAYMNHDGELPRLEHLAEAQAQLAEQRRSATVSAEKLEELRQRALRRRASDEALRRELYDAGDAYAPADDAEPTAPPVVEEMYRRTDERARRERALPPAAFPHALRPLREVGG